MSTSRARRTQKNMENHQAQIPYQINSICIQPRKEYRPNCLKGGLLFWIRKIISSTKIYRIIHKPISTLQIITIKLLSLISKNSLSLIPQFKSKNLLLIKIIIKLINHILINLTTKNNLLFNHNKKKYLYLFPIIYY